MEITYASIFFDRNDPRYVEAWLNAAELYPDASITSYMFMFRNGIGTKCASLYIQYAVEMEKSGKTRDADKIYQKGIEEGAQPIPLLQCCHK